MPSGVETGVMDTWHYSMLQRRRAHTPGNKDSAFSRVAIDSVWLDERLLVLRLCVSFC